MNFRNGRLFTGGPIMLHKWFAGLIMDRGLRGDNFCVMFTIDETGKCRLLLNQNQFKVMIYWRRRQARTWNNL